MFDWHGCDECKADHERLLSYMKELLEHRKSIMSDIDIDIYHEKIPVVLEVVKVSKFEPNFEDIE